MGVKVTNNAFGTISAGISNSDTTIVLDSGQGARFPSLSSGDFFFGTLIDTSNNLEVVKVTARSTDSMTVTRAQDNTSARAFAIGDRFELRPTAALFEAIKDEASIDGISSSADATAITINSSEQVGIKTTSPDVLLDVGDSDHGSAGNTGIQIQSSQDFTTTYDGTNTNTWPGVQITNNDETSNRTAAGITFVHRSSSSGIAGIQSTSTAADRADIRLITRGSDGINERMRLSNRGHMTLSHQPYFAAQMTGTSQYVTRSANHVFDFNSTAVNTESCFNTSNHRFTAPTAGRYLFTVSFITNDSTPTGRITFYVNGSQNFNGIMHGISGSNTGGGGATGTSAIIQLAVNDYVDVRSQAGSTQFYEDNHSSFTGILLS